MYAGQVVGEHSHDNDLVINVTKSKKLTNMRASGSDDKVRLIPPVPVSYTHIDVYKRQDCMRRQTHSIGMPGIIRYISYAIWI